jgi:hypothetical protein
MAERRPFGRRRQRAQHAFQARLDPLPLVQLLVRVGPIRPPAAAEPRQQLFVEAQHGQGLVMTEGVARRRSQKLILGSREKAGGDEGAGDRAGSAAAGAEDDHAAETPREACFAGRDDDTAVFHLRYTRRADCGTGTLGWWTCV